MAFCRIGGLTLKSVKPILVNPCVIVPSSVNLQLRHAARKGYREKLRRKKAAAALEKPPVTVQRAMTRMKINLSKLKKTVDQKKPDPPSDDVFLSQLFNYKKYTIPEAVGFHKEYHHPEIYNNPTAPISLKIEINMTGKKSTQFIKPFSGIASIPHPFVITNKRDVLVLCGPEHTELAFASGASTAGGADIIKKLQEGVIQPSLFDYVIAHVDFLPHLTPVRNLLKDKLPKAKIGTLTSDLQSAIHKFLHGIEYSCIKPGALQDFGVIHSYIGTIEMDSNHIEENFKALIEDIETNRPPRDGDFVTWAWCFSKPSDEEFCIDLSKYINTQRINDDDIDDNE